MLGAFSLVWGLRLANEYSILFALFQRSIRPAGMATLKCTGAPSVAASAERLWPVIVSPGVSLLSTRLAR